LFSFLYPSAVADNFKSYLIITIVLGVALVLSLATRVVKKSWSTKRMLTALLTTWSVLGLIIYLFRYEEVTYFDADLWITILHLGALIWLVWIIVWRFTYVPKIKQTSKIINIKEKYLPKPKHLRKRG